jgi:hypothetical protein
MKRMVPSWDFASSGAEPAIMPRERRDERRSVLLAGDLERQGRSAGSGLSGGVTAGGAVRFAQRAAITGHGTGGARLAATGGRSRGRQGAAGGTQRRLRTAGGRLRVAGGTRREERRNRAAAVAGAAKIVLVEAVSPRCEHAGHHRQTQKNLGHDRLLGFCSVQEHRNPHRDRPADSLPLQESSPPFRERDADRGGEVPADLLSRRQCTASLW